MEEIIMYEFISIVTTIVLKLVYAALIVAGGFIIAAILSNLIKKSKRLELSAKSFAASFVSIAVKILAVVSALFSLGVPAASFVTVLGSVGLAVGLAMQGALSNLAGGILIVVFHPFKIGDYITVSGQTGVVQNISVFYTTIINDDNVTVTLPNGTLTNAAILNTSVVANRKMTFEYALPYNTDIEAVRNILVSTASANEKVLSQPVPTVTVTSHTAAAVNVKLVAWVAGTDYGRTVAELNEQIKNAFDSNNIARA